MNWATELRDAFRELEAEQPARVQFAERADPLGELGREFNTLAQDWRQRGPDGLTRQQAHRLRNRLAGILAALQVLRANRELPAEEEAALRQVLDLAKQLDVRLRAG
ncbi:MAG: hypothetical protein ACE5G6_03710 [Terriglobia bacterium]